MKTRYSLLLTSAVLTASAPVAMAVGPLSFTAGQSSYLVSAGSPVVIELYLSQPVGSTLIADENGLFSAGFKALRLTTPDGTAAISSYIPDPSFDGTALISIFNDQATAYTDHASGIGPGAMPDLFGRVHLGSLFVTTPADAPSLTFFQITDDDLQTDNSITYQGTALDSVPGLTAGSFTVIASIPEPTAAVFSTFGLIALIHQRPRRRTHRRR